MLSVELNDAVCNLQVSAFCRSERAIEIKTWEQQAADSLPGPGHHPYQSQSVAFAVRAAEALAPFHAPNGAQDPTRTHEPIPAPHPSKTAICCQVRHAASGTQDNFRPTHAHSPLGAHHLCSALIWPSWTEISMMLLLACATAESAHAKGHRAGLQPGARQHCCGRTLDGCYQAFPGSALWSTRGIA